ncbi:hypothetical protein [Streptomyces lavendulae]
MQLQTVGGSYCPKCFKGAAVTVVHHSLNAQDRHACADAEL